MMKLLTPAPDGHSRRKGAKFFLQELGVRTNSWRISVAEFVSRPESKIQSLLASNPRSG